MKAGTLSQTNPAWDGPLWDLLEVLYEGGFDVSADAKRLDQMLPLHANESATNHDERKKAACYINYLGDVVDYFAAQLFTKTLTMLPDEAMKGGERYEEFAEDADGEGHSFQQLMAKAFIGASVTRKAIVAVDFPQNIEPAGSRLEEEAKGMDRPRAFFVDPCELLDWRKAEDGSFQWAILHHQTSERLTPEDTRDSVTDVWKVWDMANGVATWRRFEVTRKLNDKGALDKLEVGKEIPEVANGVTTFKRVPLVEFMLPKGLWVGNKIGPMVLEHFRRRTTLVAAQKKSLMAIPVLSLGPEIGAARKAMPSEAQQNPNRGSNPKGRFDDKGWVRIGKDDSLAFAEPEGKAYTVEAGQLDRLVDEIFRVSHLMAQSVAATSTAMSRSGQSKQEDRNATEVVLEALGDQIGTFGARIYEVIAEALGDDVQWTAKGLSEFRIRDRKQVVEEAQSVTAIKIKSPTFRKVYQTQVALRLLEDISTEDEQLIRDEIEAAAKKEEAEPDAEFGGLANVLRAMTQGDAADQDQTDDGKAPPNGKPNGKPGPAGNPARPSGS